MPATATGKLSHPVLDPDGLTSRRLRKASYRFPDRALHVVDIENLAGAAVPSLALVSEVQQHEWSKSLSFSRGFGRFAAGA